MNHQASGLGGRAGANLAVSDSGPGTVDYAMVSRPALLRRLAAIDAHLVALQIAVRDGFEAREIVPELQQILESIDALREEL